MGEGSPFYPLCPQLTHENEISWSQRRVLSTLSKPPLNLPLYPNKHCLPLARVLAFKYSLLGNGCCSKMLVFGVSVTSLPEQVLPSGTKRGLITGMDYRNGHLYVSWSTFYLVFGERQSLVRESCGLSTVCSMW